MTIQRAENTKAQFDNFHFNMQILMACFEVTRPLLDFTLVVGAANKGDIEQVSTAPAFYLAAFLSG